MLLFSGSKINLGLAITEKRADGFHNLETVFFPLKWQDAIELIESSDNQMFELIFSGIPIQGSSKDNIIYKAYELLQKDYTLPKIKVHLLKNIPMGAGLGGGSSNAVNFIKLMDQKFGLNIPVSKKTEYAKQLGSDCAFFIDNIPVLAKGKGDEFEPIKVNLSSHYIYVVYPNVHSDTKLAYQGITPKKPVQSLRTIIETKSISQWKNVLENDFESSVFRGFPQLKEIKEQLYTAGALYASMSGSGSAVYGIFESKPNLDLENYTTFLQEPHYSKV